MAAFRLNPLPYLTCFLLDSLNMNYTVWLFKSRFICPHRIVTCPKFWPFTAMILVWWLHKEPHSASFHETKRNSIFKCICYCPSFAIHCESNKPVSCLPISFLPLDWHIRLISIFLRILGADRYHKERVQALLDSSQSKKRTYSGGLSRTIHARRLHKEVVSWTAVQTWDGERENKILLYFVALLLRLNRLDKNQRLSLYGSPKLMKPHSLA